MPHAVLLNNLDHHDLRVRTQRSVELGDGVMLAHTFAAEFRNLQAHYPIVFQKSADGTQFHPVVLFGFQPGQNLFLADGRWDASCLPLAIEREPFLIGQDGDELLVHVDLDSPRLSRSEGEALFLPHGGTSAHLQHINSVLLSLHEGLQATPGFMAALLAHDLLESFVLDVEQPDGAQHRLVGFYTIDEERLAGLDGAALAQLHQAGHLQAVFMAVASLSNFRALIERQHRLGAADA